jgi:hypothetical protein
MTTVRRSVGLALVVCCLFPLSTFAQNVDAAHAAPFPIGQPAVAMAFTGGSGTQARWYVTGLTVFARSYCAETGVFPENAYEAANTLITVYRQDTTTVIGTNDDAFTSEPGTGVGSRVCWVAPATEAAFVKVTWFSTTAPATPRFPTLRVVETTLWCPWFFIDGDYNAFTLLRNTTNAAVNVAVGWRDANGTVVGSALGAIPANGNIALSARTYVTGATSGSVEVVHTGSPEAIMGSTTTLSGTTGVGFDAPFGQRRPW